MRIIKYTGEKDRYFRTAKKACDKLGVSYWTAQDYLSRKKRPYIWEGGKLEWIEVE